MKKLLLFFVFAVAAFAQNPDCQINFGPWTDTNATPASFNGITQCTYWVITYQVTGFSAISLQFESATGTNAGPGTFAAYSGTVSSGINPSTSVACATVTNCTATFTGQVGWYRVNFPSHTGSGSIQGVLKGYKVGYPLGGAAVPGAGCPGTVATPCVVVGNVADGAAVSGAPVTIAGDDGTNVQRMRTDTTGRPMVVGAAADGAAVAGNPILQAGSDGTNAETILVDSSGRQVVVGAAAPAAAPAGNPVSMGVIGSGATGGLMARQFACDSSASISYSATSGTVQLVALSAGRVIYVCDIVLSSDTATNITLEYGTGASCGTGTTVLFAALQNVLSASLGFSGAVRAPAGNALCIISSATATIGGVVTYAQF